MNDEMTGPELTDFLRDQRQHAQVLRDQWHRANQVLDKYNAEALARLEHTTPGPRDGWPNAFAVRVNLAAYTSEQLRDFHEARWHEWIAWWADAATLAVVGRGRVNRLRLAATSPKSLLTRAQEELLDWVEDLPRGPTKLERGQELSTSSWSEFARVRLWGEDWLEEQLPSLPTVEELRGDLAGSAMRAIDEGTVLSALAAVHEAVDAGRRAADAVQDLPSDADWPQDVEDLWKLHDARHDRLTDYASAVTSSLTIIDLGRIVEE